MRLARASSCWVQIASACGKQRESLFLEGSDSVRNHTGADKRGLHWVACDLDSVYRCDAVDRWAGGLARHLAGCTDHFVSGDAVYLGFDDVADALEALRQLEDLGIYPEASAFEVYSEDELPPRP